MLKNNTTRIVGQVDFIFHFPTIIIYNCVHGIWSWIGAVLAQIARDRNKYTRGWTPTTTKQKNTLAKCSESRKMALAFFSRVIKYYRYVILLFPFHSFENERESEGESSTEKKIRNEH